jgi:hypothetical protein
LQALELVNGETLTHWLSRGAKKMLGELPPDPVALADQTWSQKTGSMPFEVDVTGAAKVWMVLKDMGTYSPEKVEAIWADAELVGPAGAVQLASLQPLDGGGLRESSEAAGGVRVKTPSVVAYDIAGRGFTKLRGRMGLENKDITSEINPQVRFFVFDKEPNPERLTPVSAEAPLQKLPVLKTAPAIVDRLFRSALGRAPTAEERRSAEAGLTVAGKVRADALADLLWAILMKPEFQLVY